MAVALGISTLLIDLGLLALLGRPVLVRAAVGLARLSLVVLAAAALAFGGASLLLAAIPAAVIGVVLYARSCRLPPARPRGGLALRPCPPLKARQPALSRPVGTPLSR